MSIAGPLPLLLGGLLASPPSARPVLGGTGPALPAAVPGQEALRARVLQSPARLQVYQSQGAERCCKRRLPGRAGTRGDCRGEVRAGPRHSPGTREQAADPGRLGSDPTRSAVMPLLLRARPVFPTLVLFTGASCVLNPLCAEQGLWEAPAPSPVSCSSEHLSAPVSDLRRRLSPHPCSRPRCSLWRVSAPRVSAPLFSSPPRSVQHLLLQAASFLPPAPLTVQRSVAVSVVAALCSPWRLNAQGCGALWCTHGTVQPCAGCAVNVNRPCDRHAVVWGDLSSRPAEGALHLVHPRSPCPHGSPQAVLHRWRENTVAQADETKRRGPGRQLTTEGLCAPR